MKKLNNWNDVDETESINGQSKRLPAGAYVVKVTKVIDDENNTDFNGNIEPSVEVVFDIDEGSQKGFFDGMPDKCDFLHSIKFLYIKNKGYYKHFYSTLERENGFTWNLEKQDPNDFIGKKFGIVISQYHYIYNDAKRDKNVVRQIISCDEARNWSEPVEDTFSDEYKDYQGDNSSDFSNADYTSSEEVPF